MLNTYIKNNAVKVLILYAIFLRLIIVIVYQSVTIYPDSQNYIDLANYIYQLSLQNYTGERTPGFPLLIAICNSNLIFTIIIQLVLGVLTTFLIYDFSKLNTKNTKLSFWIGFVFTSFIHVIFFDLAILTESASP